MSAYMKMPNADTAISPPCLMSAQLTRMDVIRPATFSRKVENPQAMTSRMIPGLNLGLTNLRVRFPPKNGQNPTMVDTTIAML